MTLSSLQNDRSCLLLDLQKWRRCTVPLRILAPWHYDAKLFWGGYSISPNDVS